MIQGGDNIKKILSVHSVVVLVGTNILLSFLLLAMNWIFLNEYINYMSQSDIVNNDKSSAVKTGYVLALVFRSLFSIFWIFTFILFRKIIIKRIKGIWWVLFIYGVASISAYTYYVFKDSFYLFTLIRALQLFVSSIFFIIIFTKVFRLDLKGEKNYE